MVVALFSGAVVVSACFRVVLGAFVVVTAWVLDPPDRVVASWAVVVVEPCVVVANNVVNVVDDARVVTLYVVVVDAGLVVEATVVIAEVLVVETLVVV